MLECDLDKACLIYLLSFTAGEPYDESWGAGAHEESQSGARDSSTRKARVSDRETSEVANVRHEFVV
jgi:hypothetical protein